MRIFKYGTSFFLLSLFAGCSNSAMTMEKEKRLFIADDKAVIGVKTALDEKESINMGTLYIGQYIVAANEENCKKLATVLSAFCVKKEQELWSAELARNTD